MLFEHATAAQSVINSFLYAGAAATAGVIITLGVAYIVTRRLVPFGGVLGFLCMAPFVIPGVVLAIGFYAAYAPPPLALYGTALILILAFTTRFLPIGYVNASAAHAQHQPGDGGGGAHPGRQPAHRAAPRRGAAAQAQPAGRLAAGLHPGDARAVVGDLPLRAEHQGRVGDDLRHERGGEFRVPRRPGPDPAGADPAAARGSANARSGATSC